MFSNGCVAAPHHLASSAGLAVLRSGGNAVDAAVSANLVLAVVAPHLCGAGGDLFAIVWDGQAHAVASNGRAPAGATPGAVRDAVDAGHGDPAVSLPHSGGMPSFGALPVTVPGAIAGWFHLLERHGTRSFGELSRAAVRHARDGIDVSEVTAAAFARGQERHGAMTGWAERFGRLGAGDRLVQPELARALELLASDGPDVFYRGPIGAAAVDVLQRHGSTMCSDDLAAHQVRRVRVLSTGFRDVEVLELPPATQGPTALTALAVVEASGTAADPGLRAHVQVEAVRGALVDRDRYLTDPAHMRVDPQALFAPERISGLAAAIDPQRAAAWPSVRPAPGGTSYLCAADRDGLLVSLIQSNYMGFGSGLLVPGFGIGLHNRGAHFSLDPDHVNVIAPGKQTLHTLIPALALRDGRPWLVFGTMGGDGQPQTHLQLLSRVLDEGDDPQRAVDAPRWFVDPADGSVAIESRAPAEVVDGLRRRGHEVSVLGESEQLMGHAHAIEVTASGYRAGSDPRAEGAAVGW